MPTDKDTKEAIQLALNNFQTKDLPTASYDFWKVLGYSSERRYEQTTYTFEEFAARFTSRHTIREDRALKANCKEICLLFQLTDEEILDCISQTSQQTIPGLEDNHIKESNLKSYLFASVELYDGSYTRTQLATLSREINRCFAMPVLLLIKIGNRLTFSVINRRMHKRDASKDVLEKVTLIKDIELQDVAHRAHIEILFDLNIGTINRKNTISSFDQLHKEWTSILDVTKLNKRFYKEVSNWFFWAVQNVNFPDGEDNDKEKRNTIGIIRLLTRLIFVWFMKEKKLVPDSLFDNEYIRQVIRFGDTSSSSYYKAILQNLFFATLNTEMNKDRIESRRFRKSYGNRISPEFNVHTLYRYRSLFRDPDNAIRMLFDDIPFINGGLFECLDHEVMQDGCKRYIRIDGFSDREDNVLQIPNFLFWLETELECDLNHFYGTKNKRYKVSGIIEILKKYKFTVAENTPVEEEIALDPELLGHVFENLLAAYNPETRSTARKETGSYYTPREIVDFMVNESLIFYLKSSLLKNCNESMEEDLELRLRLLFEYRDENALLSDEECTQIIKAIDNCTILDPACGSGAFLMGLLQKMAYVLNFLDPDNTKWKQQQILRIQTMIQDAKTLPDEQVRQSVLNKLNDSISDIEQSFNIDVNYSRKLFLIEHCLYGVDIQPIAIQISKLRYFITLLVDQSIRHDHENLGVRSLPNLETNLISANSLFTLGYEQQQLIFDKDFDEYKLRLRDIHKDHFLARSRKEKLDIRAQEEKLKQEFTKHLEDNAFPHDKAIEFLGWNPYSSNKCATFFDPDIMFGIDRFDIVIENPPYVESRNSLLSDDYKTKLQHLMTIKHPKDHILLTRGADLLIYFIERSTSLIKPTGLSCIISQNSWLSTHYGLKFTKFLLRNANVLRIIDSDFKYFDTIQINTVISFITSKSSVNDQVSFETHKSRFGDSIDNVIVKKVKHDDERLKDYKWDLQFSEYDIMEDLLMLNKLGIKFELNRTISVGQGLNIESNVIQTVDFANKKGVPNRFRYPIYTVNDGAPFVLEDTHGCLIDATYAHLKTNSIELFDRTKTKKQPPMFFLPRGLGRHYACYNKLKAFTTSNVEIYVSEKLEFSSIIRMWLFLNSSLFWLIREILGRKNLGGGMLKAEAVDIEDIPMYYDIPLGSEATSVYNRLSTREALTTLIEIDSEEHRIIDSIIGCYFGFSQHKQEKVVLALKNCIKRRSNKANTT